MTRTPTSDIDQLAYLGHGTVALHLVGARLITDPVFRNRVAFLRRIGARPGAPAPVSAALVSHLHADHCDIASLRLLPDVPVVVPTGAAEFLSRRGVRHLIELSAGESWHIRGIRVTATPAVHDGRRSRLGGPAAAAVGYLVEARGRRVYFAGDTDLFDEMHALGDNLDVALLPVSGWGPTLGDGHLTPETAAEAVARLRPRLAVPIHWGTFAIAGLGRRTTDEPARRFAAAVAARRLATSVRVLSPGASVALGPLAPPPAPPSATTGAP